jgi:hypothetical protein
MEANDRGTEPDEGRESQDITAGRDAFVAGRDQFVINVNVPQATQDEPSQPEQGLSDPPGAGDNSGGLGRHLFTASVPRHSGQLSVAFGANNTLVVTEKDTTVHRWSLGDGTPLNGAPASPAPRFNVMRVDVGTRMAASTTMPAVAVSRGARVTLLHFGSGGYRTATIELGTSECLVPADGARFATYDGHGVAVRDFADGSVIWRAPGPRGLATATIDRQGKTVAMAGGPNLLAGSNKVVVVAQDDPGHPRDFAFANLPVAAGCHLGMSPDGELVACVSFREIVVVRPRTREVVRRRPLGSLREDVMASLGTRPHRLICSPQGDVLWYRGHRIVDVNWSPGASRYLPQAGLCDDIAFDHATARLAAVSESGQVDVWEWRPRAPVR